MHGLRSRSSRRSRNLDRGGRAPASRVQKQKRTHELQSARERGTDGSHRGGAVSGSHWLTSRRALKPRSWLQVTGFGVRLEQLDCRQVRAAIRQSVLAAIRPRFCRWIDLKLYVGTGAG